jgi:hypothetical protein
MPLLLTPTQSQRRRTVKASFGECKGSRICCARARVSVRRRSESSNASSMKCQRSRKGQRQRDDVTLIVMNVQKGCEV